MTSTGVNQRYSNKNRAFKNMRSRNRDFKKTNIFPIFSLSCVNQLLPMGTFTLLLSANMNNELKKMAFLRGNSVTVIL